MKSLKIENAQKVMAHNLYSCGTCGKYVMLKNIGVIKMISKKRRTVKYKQKGLNQKYAFLFIMNLIVVLDIIFMAFIVGARGNNKSEDDSRYTAYESNDNHKAVTTSANVPSENEMAGKYYTYCRNLSENDKFMLAKIAMAEAENKSLYNKVLVILTVLNRVESSCEYFPDTIEEVILQNYNGVYQFNHTIPGGKYWTVEPNSECWEAVDIVNKMEDDISEGALYFESCTNPDNWYSKNLEFLFESDGMRFYK